MLVLGEADRLVEYAEKHYESFDFHKPATRIRHFIWESFASHYLELVKGRAYNQERRYSREEQNAAIWTLNEVLEKMLRALYPIIPFITHKICSDIYGENIEELAFPKPDGKPPGKKPAFGFSDIEKVNSGIWKAKKDSGASLKSEVSEATIPDKLKPIKDDIKTTHNIKKLVFGKRFSVKLG